MPYSYGKYKNEVRDKIKSCFNPETEILDVGAGSGVYSDLLWDTHKNLDALEIFPNYIQMFELEKRYRSVIQADINHFNFEGYGLLIMGDILEHLTIQDAHKILDKIKKNNQGVMVAVPYLYEQGEEFGNIHETHLQPELTPEVMLERYPDLTLLYGDENYGYYVNSFFSQKCNQL